MSPGEAHLMVAEKYLNLVVTVEICGSPKFLLELLLSFLVVSIYIYLNFEVNRMRQKEYERRKSILIQQKRIFQEAQEKLNNTGNQFRKGSDFGHFCKPRDMSQADNGKDCRRPRSRSLLGSKRITALMPSQFVRLDKQEQICNMQTSACIHSLSKYIRRISKNRDKGTQSNTGTDKKFQRYRMEFIDSEKATESLVGVLNEIIDDTAKDVPHVLSAELKSFVQQMNNHELPISSSHSDTSQTCSRAPKSFSKIKRLPN